MKCRPIPGAPLSVELGEEKNWRCVFLWGPPNNPSFLRLFMNCKDYHILLSSKNADLDEKISSLRHCYSKPPRPQWLKLTFSEKFAKMLQFFVKNIGSKLKDPGGVQLKSSRCRRLGVEIFIKINILWWYFMCFYEKL